MVDAAEIGLQIGTDQLASQPSESQLRPLKSVPEEARKAILEEATRKAILEEATRKAEEEHAKLTAKRVAETVAEWKQRNEEWKAQWKGERDKAGQLQTELDIAKALLNQKPETPADYESTKAKAGRKSLR